MKNVEYNLLTTSQRELLQQAKLVMETAYNPYSRFYVGAALLSRDGQIITGSNVENAAYGSTICAERSALVRANAQGVRVISKVAVIGRGDKFDTTEVTGPCGSCRQMLYETAQISERDLEIIMATTKMDKIVIATIGELLPLAFGPKDLGIEVKKYQ